MLGFLHRSSGSHAPNLQRKLSNGALNGDGQTNGYLPTSPRPDILSVLKSPTLRPATPSRSISGLSVGKRSTKQLFIGAGMMERASTGAIKEVYAGVRQRTEQELGSHTKGIILDASYQSLREWIQNERLTRVPHKGGHWDRVLVKVQHFIEQIHSLTEAIEGFAEDVVPASHLMYGHCLLLLELGHENAGPLEKAFHLFYQFGLEILPLLRCVHLFGATTIISESVSNIYSDLLNIVTAVSITFYRAVHSGRDETVVDIYRSFGSQIEMFHTHISHTTYAMWSFSLSGDDETDRERLDMLQKRLAPQDTLLAFLASKRINIACSPAQFTCTWFQPHLNSFIRSEKRVLIVQGFAHSGKTTLANWTIDRFHRTVGRKNLTTISFFFNPSIELQKSGLSLVKTLLYQLLFQRIGDEHLFNAINDAVLKLPVAETIERQETHLWTALANALSHLSEREDDGLVIIVDGIDAITPKDAAVRVCQQLYDLTKTNPAIRIIQFSRPIEKLQQPAKHSVLIQLDTETMRNDMTAFAKQKLHRHPTFHGLSEPDQEKTVVSLIGAAGTSFLWLHLACKFLNLQHQPFDKALEAFLPTSKHMDDAVHKLVASLPLDQDSRSVLSYVVTAQRPLLYEEIKLLLQAQPDRFSMIQRSVDIERILQKISPLLLVIEGVVAIRQYSVKQAMVATTSPSKWLTQGQDRHRELLLRIMIYAKTCMLGEHEATLQAQTSGFIDSKLQGHSLLEYVVRYWALHFEKTTNCKTSGPLSLPADLKPMFPTSVTFALLEEGCWVSQSTPAEAVKLHMTAYRVREALYGQEKACVLQSALTVAKILELVLCRVSDAIEWYHKALKASIKTVGLNSEMSVILCLTILRLSENFVVGKRSTIMEWREDVMLTLIMIYGQRHGSHSKEVIEIRKMIIELYIFIHEEHKCEEHRKLIDIEIGVGNGGSLNGKLKLGGSTKLRKHKELKRFDSLEEGFLNGYVEEGVEVTFTLEMVARLLLQINVYIKDGQFERAEELYIELWLRLTERCQTLQDFTWHAKKIEIMISYSRFLHTHKRESEASAILVCIWREYEHHECSSFEAINVLLKEVAILTKSLGLLTMSLAIFSKCWSYFKHAHQTETVIFKEIESSITIVSSEIIKTSTTSETSETIIKEIFRSSLSSSETVTTTTIELCESLSSTYIKEERYSEAVVCIESVLRKSWASFFLESEVMVSLEFTSVNIELVKKLALCYLHQKRFEKVEEIYLRLYRVYRKSYAIDSETVVSYVKMILEFYKEHSFFTKAIAFYQELLVEYRVFYGASGTVTIKTLYAVADLCKKHHITHGYWIEYYLEIVNVLNKGSIHCHKEALRALVIVAEYYYETSRYSEALVFFKSIFATFMEHGLAYQYFENTLQVQLLVEHYFRSIEESQTEIELHISMIKELRKACLKHYKEKSQITINVSLVLATVYRRSIKHEFEAISLYEYICQYSETRSKEITTSLQYLYYKQVTTSTTTVEQTTIEKAVTMTHEHYVHIRQTYSCFHEKTLTVLKELIHLWYKQNKTELIVNELRSLIIEIISTVKVSEELIGCAKFLAEIFVYCGYQEQALLFIHQLRQQVIYKIIVAGCKFNITHIGRSALAFIAALQFYVRADWTTTLSIVMVDLVAEYSYYHRFTMAIKAKASIEMVFSHGARLRHILLRSNRLVDFAVTENKMVEYFVSIETGVMKHCQKPAVQVFVVLLLKYYSTHQSDGLFTATAGHAAIAEIESLLKKNEQKKATELTKCVFYFLMAHEGLDDPTEITMGFRLSLLMGGRIVGRKADSTMLLLSNAILTEVFDICKNYDINVARIALSELDELIEMLGEQKDYSRLHWLLRMLWDNRESQNKWAKDVVLRLGMRLVQAEFAAGHIHSAIHLCEDIVYNVRRVYGPRHQNTLRCCELQASLYTSIGVKYQHGNNKNDAEQAKYYFRRALTVHEDALKAFVGWEDANQDDDDDDGLSDYGSLVKGQEIQRVTFDSEQEENNAAVRHVRKLRLAMQRLGGWSKAADEFERLTDSVWKAYGPHLKLKEDEVKAGHWKIEKLSAEEQFDCFNVPQTWSLVGASA